MDATEIREIEEQITAAECDATAYLFALKQAQLKGTVTSGKGVSADVVQMKKFIAECQKRADTLRAKLAKELSAKPTAPDREM